MPKAVLSPAGATEVRTPGGGDKDDQLNLCRCYQLCVDMRNARLQHLLGTIDTPASKALLEPALRDMGCLGFVPDNCVQTYAQALEFGVRGDYRLAAALLVPLLEHVLRSHLQSMGKPASSRSGDGTDRHRTLEWVVRELDRMGGWHPDFLFEVGMLLSEPAPKGLNIRNRWAHGHLCLDSLAHAGEFFSVWWLCLKAALEPPRS